jgi:hypothetical protein
VYVFTNTQYFVRAFLPTILVVLFTLPWLIIDKTVKNLESFHQLSKLQGARASKTLCRDYARPAPLAPVKALITGQWNPFLTSVIADCTIVLIPLAPEFASARVDGNCSSTSRGCVLSLSVFPIAGRAIEALLILLAIFTILLIFQMHNYSTGVLRSP